MLTLQLTVHADADEGLVLRYGDKPVDTSLVRDALQSLQPGTSVRAVCEYLSHRLVARMLDAEARLVEIDALLANGELQAARDTMNSLDDEVTGRDCRFMARRAALASRSQSWDEFDEALIWLLSHAPPGHGHVVDTRPDAGIEPEVLLGLHEALPVDRKAEVAIRLARWLDRHAHHSPALWEFLDRLPQEAWPARAFAKRARAAYELPESRATEAHTRFVGALEGLRRHHPQSADIRELEPLLGDFSPALGPGDVARTFGIVLPRALRDAWAAAWGRSDDPAGFLDVRAIGIRELLRIARALEVVGRHRSEEPLPAARHARADVLPFAALPESGDHDYLALALGIPDGHGDFAVIAAMDWAGDGVEQSWEIVAPSTEVWLATWATATKSEDLS